MRIGTWYLIQRMAAYVGGSGNEITAGEGWSQTKNHRKKKPTTTTKAKAKAVYHHIPFEKRNPYQHYRDEKNKLHPAPCVSVCQNETRCQNAHCFRIHGLFDPLQKERLRKMRDDRRGSVVCTDGISGRCDNGPTKCFFRHFTDMVPLSHHQSRCINEWIRFHKLDTKKAIRHPPPRKLHVVVGAPKAVSEVSKEKEKETPFEVAKELLKPVNPNVLAALDKANQALEVFLGPTTTGEMDGTTMKQSVPPSRRFRQRVIKTIVQTLLEARTNQSEDFALAICEKRGDADALDTAHWRFEMMHHNCSLAEWTEWYQANIYNAIEGNPKLFTLNKTKTRAHITPAFVQLMQPAANKLLR